LKSAQKERKKLFHSFMIAYVSIYRGKAI